jgi:hypothetical protein
MISIRGHCIIVTYLICISRVQQLVVCNYIPRGWELGKLGISVATPVVGLRRHHQRLTSFRHHQITKSPESVLACPTIFQGALLVVAMHTNRADTAQLASL